MPDPFLENLDLGIGFDSAKSSASFYGARVWREENLVFLKCKNLQQIELLARIDCKGYPETLPEVTFLDPSNKKVTADAKFWPPGLGPLPSRDGFGICMAGTRAYAQHHGNPGVRFSLGKLVEILILCCRGHREALRLIYNMRR